MKFISMFKTPKNRSFNIKPRYYDAEKEAFEQRINSIRLENGAVYSDSDAVKVRLKKHFSDKRIARTTYSSKKSNIRIFIIIAILSALSYWLLK